MAGPFTPMRPALVPVDLGDAARGAGIRAAFTTRAAGNLGLDVDDDPAAVRARRAGLGDRAGRPVAFAHQVHGTTVLDGDAQLPPEPTGDAWCATGPSALAVLTADCLPVLLADPAAGVIGAAHAGRVGLLGGVLAATVGAMRARGASEITAIIGPAICGRCYEVSGELAVEAGGAGLPVGTSRWGTPALDLPAIAVGELAGLGVAASDVGVCTLEDPRYFSHRSPDRFRGRQAGLISLAASGSGAPSMSRSSKGVPAV